MSTRIHPIGTGTVTVKEALRGGRAPAWRRRTAIFTDRVWSAPRPIHCWLIEHDDGPILVDAGAVAGARDLPFARFAVGPDDEIDDALARLGLAPADLRLVVLTHAHGDHVDGLARLAGVGAAIGADELRVVRSRGAAVGRRLLRIPLPAGFDPAPLVLGPDPFGAFDRSLALTGDGSVVVVATPGHTPGHVSVIVVIDGRHHFLAGDATYDQAQLLALQVDGIAPKPARSLETMRTILAHAARHPTVYLPTHDPGARARLDAAEVLKAA